MNKFVIKLVAEINNSHINASTSDNVGQVRLNDLGLKAILEFDADDDIAKEVFINETWYTLEEIQGIIISEEEWQ